MVDAPLCTRFKGHQRDQTKESPLSHSFRVIIRSQDSQTLGGAVRRLDACMRTLQLTYELELSPGPQTDQLTSNSGGRWHLGHRHGGLLSCAYRLAICRSESLHALSVLFRPACELLDVVSTQAGRLGRDEVQDIGPVEPLRVCTSASLWGTQED